MGRSGPLGRLAPRDRFVDRGNEFRQFRRRGGRAQNVVTTAGGEAVDGTGDGFEIRGGNIRPDAIVRR